MIVDVINRCRDRRDEDRGLDGLEGVMLHRCGIDKKTGVVLGYDAPTVSDAFTGKAPQWGEVAKATGRQNAYTFMVGGDLGPLEFDGVLWQCLPLDEIGWHGRRFSRGWIGLGWIADPRVQPLSPRARATMLELAAALCLWFGWDPLERIRGHGEVSGAHGGEKAPGLPAACPGLSQEALDQFREDATHVLPRSVLDLGVVFTRP